MTTPVIYGADYSTYVRTVPSRSRRSRGQDRYLAGPEISLADLFLAPIFAYLNMTPDATELLQDCSGLRTWWREISDRHSMIKTQPKLG